MNSELVKVYRKLRSDGYHSREALYNARIQFEFDNLSDLCEIRFEPDSEMYDDSYIDTWTDLTDKQREHYRRKIHNQIESDGVYSIFGCVKCPTCGHMEVIDSIHGFIGTDGCGYEFDIMNACIDAIKQKI